MSEEQARLDQIAAWYLQRQLDFDRRMIRYRYDALRPHLKGPTGLELGSAEGEMTRLLIPHFDHLVAVDAARDLLDRIPDAPNLTKHCSLFEAFHPKDRFDTIIMEHVLEHVAEPVELLRKARTWLVPRGRLLIGVPNAHSIHRLVAVKMQLLQAPTELNARDVQVGHRRVYTPRSLAEDIESAGLRMLERGGVFLKPVSNQQMEDHWTEEMIEGFAKLGGDFPDHAAEIYAICTFDT